MDKLNSVEPDIEDDDSSSKNGKKRTSYVSRDHKSMVEFAGLIYRSLGPDYHHGTAIAALHKLSPVSIKQQITSCQQYRLLEIKHGVGYKITDLFKRIYLPVNDSEKIAAVVDSLKSPETYQQLFKEYEYHIVPPVTGIKNHFVRNFQFKDDIAEKAAEVFIQNLKDYSLLDSRGVLISGIAAKTISNKPEQPEKSTEQQAERPKQEQPVTQAPPKTDDSLFELPIPLPNRRKAFLRYPLDNLTKRDIRVITKALEFIASSLDDEEGG